MAPGHRTGPHHPKINSHGHGLRSACADGGDQVSRPQMSESELCGSWINSNNAAPTVAKACNGRIFGLSHVKKSTCNGIARTRVRSFKTLGGFTGESRAVNGPGLSMTPHCHHHHCRQSPEAFLLLRAPGESCGFVFKTSAIRTCSSPCSPNRYGRDGNIGLLHQIWENSKRIQDA